MVIRRFLLFIVLGVLCHLRSFAQDSGFWRADAALSFAPENFSGSISFSRSVIPVKKWERLRFDYGLRASSFVAANQYYTTAPAKFTSPRQDLLTIFSETIDANIDTITTATGQTNSINLFIGFEYNVYRRWSVGMNIDLLGLSFGASKRFNIISSSFDPDQSPVIEAKPTPFNLLLTSDNDLGSLNSEFFARYSPEGKLSFKAGLTFIFSEYTTDRKLSFNNGDIRNDRYRYKSAMFMIGATYRLGK